MAEDLVPIKQFWVCAAMVSHSQPFLKWLWRNDITLQNGSQKYPILGHFKTSQRVKFATKYLKSTTRQYQIRFSCYFHWKTYFYCISSIIKNPVVTVWYYHFSFLSNIETQVGCRVKDKIGYNRLSLAKICTHKKKL